MRTLIGLVVAASVLTGGPALAAPRDPAPGVRAPGSGRLLVVPADLWPAKYGAAARPGAPRSRLMLSHRTNTGFTTTFMLTCEPAGGGHPRAAAACATLARVDADPDRITQATTACILIYAPVTAELTGSWRGTRVTWKHRYGNTCEMRRATGVLFDF